MLKMNRHSSLISRLIGAVLVLNTACLYAIDGGVYLLKEGSPGSDISFPGGYPAKVDRKLDSKEYDLDVVSASNTNDLFEIRLTDRLGKAPGETFLAIVVDGKIIVENGGNHNFDKCDLDTAMKTAALTGRKPYMRRNVVAALSMSFKPKKKAYRGREPIEFSVEVKNVGAESLFMQRELPSKDRSAEMDIMPSEGSPVSCKDVRSQSDKVSIMEPRGELKPGEVVELRKEDLGRWFIPERAGAPTFRVVYQFAIFESLTAPYPVWVEHFADTLRIVYEGDR
jgi:hypothetical protein